MGNSIFLVRLHDMKNSQKFGLVALTVCLFGILPANASVSVHIPQDELELIQSQEGDQLADSLLPIHYYLHQSHIIRLIPPSQNVFSQRLNRLSPIQPTR
jgi:hypothetical protein